MGDENKDTNKDKKVKKELRIKTEPGGLHSVVVVGGGRVPADLAGHWTNRTELEKAIKERA